MDGETTPLVSVIIAAYQRPDYVTQAVESVLAQTFDDYELIVVDDASGEQTLREYKLPACARLIVHETRRRTAAARNTGIQAARGKYIALLDQDDLWLPEKLRTQAETMEANPEYYLTFSHYTPVDDDLNPLPSKRRPRRSAKNSLRRLIWGCFIRTPSITLFRRDAAIESGLFDESIVGASDWDFYLRLARDRDFLVSPKSLALYRMHPGQLHRDDTLMFTAKLRILEKTLAWATEKRPELRPAVRRSFCRVLREIARLRLGTPGTATEILQKAIRMWPWNVRSYGLLLRAEMARRTSE